MAERTCSVEACGAVAHPGMLMCRSHWRRVPRLLQREVWRTWDDYRDACARGDRGLSRQALGAYRTAVDAANEAVAPAEPELDLEAKHG